MCDARVRVRMQKPTPHIRVSPPICSPGRAVTFLGAEHRGLLTSEQRENRAGFPAVGAGRLGQRNGARLATLVSLSELESGLPRGPQPAAS